MRDVWRMKSTVFVSAVMVLIFLLNGLENVLKVI